MKSSSFSQIIGSALIIATAIFSGTQNVWARVHHHAAKAKNQHSHKHQTHRTHTHIVHQYSGSKHKIVVVGRYRLSHKLAHHRRHHVSHIAHKTRYAYPLNFFLISPPEYDNSLLSTEMTSQIRDAFDNGMADKYPSRALTRAGIVGYVPLHGGIFFRREPVKYIIMHSTETGVPQDAKHVISSWSSGGRRHAGAQYVVDRDGKIYQAVDPDLATVHINIFKTLPGINNDNAIGIEMVHAGNQTYTREQLNSVIKLVVYLQGRYQVSNENIITHRYAQQGDHTDPVSFDWNNFIEQKNQLQNKALSTALNQISADAKHWHNEAPLAPTLLQPNGQLPVPHNNHKTAGIPKNKEDAIVKQPETQLRGPIELDPNSASLLNKQTPVSKEK